MENGVGEKAFRKNFVSSLVFLQLYFLFFFLVKNFKGVTGRAWRQKIQKKVITERRPGWSPKTNSIMPSKPSSGGRLISISAFSMVRAWGTEGVNTRLIFGLRRQMCSDQRFERN